MKKATRPNAWYPRVNDSIIQFTTDQLITAIQYGKLRKDIVSFESNTSDTYLFIDMPDGTVLQVSISTYINQLKKEMV